jgi:hypothetical protein
MGNNKVYMVIGMAEEEYQYAIHSTLQVAIKELDLIVEEANQDAEEMGNNIPDLEWTIDANGIITGMTLTFGDTSVETYTIYEREIDFIQI